MRVYLKQIAILTTLLSTLIIGSCNKEPEKKVPLDPKVEKFTVSPDFVIEHLYSPSENENGSWVSMTFDDKGRMITSDQYGALYRLKLPPIGGDSSLLKIEKLNFPNVDIAATDTSKTKVEMGYAQGLLWAFNSLYVMVNHKGDENFKKGSGLYRLQDTNGDDQFDKITKLISLEGEGEHGPHSVVLGPDGKSIYVIAGNHTDVPKMDSYRLPSNWKEDNLFQLIKDPQGHANDRMAPGGWIAKTDSVGKNWELIGAGFRNPFDLTFNDEGEMFAYDSDMEWDFGMPWYRPTRLMHVTSGSEFGWRTGNSKWSPSYPDNLPAMINIGQGSPTNLIYAGKANFPEKYRKSLFAFDWSFGIIYSIKLEPQGATYKATAEEFISGAPLPLTDGEIGPDGALYFLTGGRKLISDLYRVTYKKQDEIKEAKKTEKLAEETPEQKIRKELEQYHKPSDIAAIKFIWPYLKHDDRHIRYAARIALEHQPVNSWIKLAWKERNIHAITQSHIAMARMGHSNLKSNMLKKLMTINIERISLERKIDLLRAFELVISRMGMPNEQDKNLVINYLDKIYPTSINSLNRDLSKILVHLGDPQVVGKTLSILFDAKDDSTYQETVTKSSDLILRNPQYGLDIANMLAKTPPAQQIYLATVLSKAKNGWTSEKSEQYFKWFYDAFGFKGGNSYIGFVDKARKFALENVPKSEYAHYNTISGDSLLSKSGTSLAQTEEGPKGPGRGWTMKDALPIIEENSGDRDLKQGKMLFSAIRCGTCHSFQGEGGSIGPDLTQLGTRFSAKDMLAALINPSDVISDQYASKVFYHKDGTSTLGRLTNEDDDAYYISQNPYAPQTIKKVPKKDVTEVRLAKISLMPPGTINALNESELKNLIAYIMSGGTKTNTVSK